MTIRNAALSIASPFYFAPPPGGFYWLENPADPHDKKKKGHYLVGHWTEEWTEAHELSDREVEKLFLRFSELNPTRESVLEFANQYGPLGIFEAVQINRAICGAESLDRWTQEIERMRWAVELAAAVARGDRARLRKWLSFRDPHRLLYKRGGKIRFGTSGLEPVSQHVVPGRFSRAGRIVLHEMVNKKLSGGTRAGMVYDPKGDGRLLCRLIVNDLLSGMWMQFANSITDDRVKQCESASCKKVIILAPGKRSDRKTCDDNCKAQLHRQRRKKAASAKGGKKK